MKAFIVLAALLAVALATGYSSGGYEQSYAAPMVTKQMNMNSGKSYQYRKQSGWLVDQFRFFFR